MGNANRGWCDGRKNKRGTNWINNLIFPYDSQTFRDLHFTINFLKVISWKLKSCKYFAGNSFHEKLSGHNRLFFCILYKTTCCKTSWKYLLAKLKKKNFTKNFYGNNCLESRNPLATIMGPLKIFLKNEKNFNVLNLLKKRKNAWNKWERSLKVFR